MNISRLVANFGPRLVEQWLTTQVFADDAQRELARELALDAANAVADGLLEQERTTDTDRRARHIVDLAVHLVHAGAGEPTQALGIEAVEIVQAMFEHAEKLLEKK